MALALRDVEGLAVAGDQQKQTEAQHVIAGESFAVDVSIDQARRTALTTPVIVDVESAQTDFLSVNVLGSGNGASTLT